MYLISNTKGLGAVLSLMLIGVMPLSVLAKQNIEQLIEAEQNALVKIEHQKGAVQIIAWAQNAVEVTGVLHSDEAELMVERRGRVISIEVEHKSGSGTWFSGDSMMEADLVVRIPAQGSVDFESLNGKLSVEGIQGGVDAELVNGSIDVSNTAGDLHLITVNGSINARDVSGRMNLETVNGDIELTHSGKDKVKLGTVNGEIEVKSDTTDLVISAVNASMDLALQTVQDLSLDMVNGRVDAQLSLADKGSIEASSVGGRMTFAFANDVAARFRIDAHAGGRIDNNLTNDEVVKQKYGPSRSLNFTTGDGSGRVDIDTVSGRVVLTKP
jgi:DUF4097 and DUF4098 domain-containing protein YvlB